jgi:5,6,7,8-tetrahydromethanopterin hydro-lyase
VFLYNPPAKRQLNFNLVDFITAAERKRIMSERIGIRVGEALVRGSTKPTAAEPELVIGEMDGPVGQAFATLLGDQVKGHTRVLALLNGDVAVKPATLMVSKVTVNKNKYTNILMGTVQAAVANGVLDAVREGIIPKEKANDLAIIAAIWVTPAAADDPDLDHQDLFDTHRKAMFEAIRKAMQGEPSIDWLLENQDKIEHKYFKLGLAGELPG